MTFAGINYLAVLIAAAAGWVVGHALVHGASRRPGWRPPASTKEKIAEPRRRRPGASLPFVFAFAACVVMAWVLAGLDRTSRPGDDAQRRDFRPVLLGRLRHHHHAGQQQLRDAQPHAAADRRRLLAGRAGADGRRSSARSGCRARRRGCAPSPGKSDHVGMARARICPRVASLSRAFAHPTECRGGTQTQSIIHLDAGVADGLAVAHVVVGNHRVAIPRPRSATARPSRH